jgi:nicotinic acid mononucleotide adenylyltransferase
MRILKTILLILIYHTSFGQDTIMYLHSWKKPNKIDKISNDVYINIDFNKNDTLNKVYPKSCGGVLLFVLKDKIIMSIDNEELEKNISNGTTVRSINNYSLNDSALKKIKSCCS